MSTVPSPTLTDNLFEMIFADDVETPPKTKKSKLDIQCEELDIPPVIKYKSELENPNANLSWDAWKLKKDADVKDTENMSCWDAWELQRMSTPVKKPAMADNHISSNELDRISSDESDSEPPDLRWSDSGTLLMQ